MKLSRWGEVAAHDWLIFIVFIGMFLILVARFFGYCK